MGNNKSREREKLRAEKENNEIVEPLEQNKVLVDQLAKKKAVHDTIMAELSGTQKEILGYEGAVKEIEWQYEVRLQQFQYLEREKKSLFDEFHRLVYEIH